MFCSHASMDLKLYYGRGKGLFFIPSNDSFFNHIQTTAWLGGVFFISNTKIPSKSGVSHSRFFYYFSVLLPWFLYTLILLLLTACIYLVSQHSFLFFIVQAVGDCFKYVIAKPTSRILLQMFQVLVLGLRHLEVWRWQQIMQWWLVTEVFWEDSACATMLWVWETACTLQINRDIQYTSDLIY